jgi:hypothetical protein
MFLISPVFGSTVLHLIDSHNSLIITITVLLTKNFTWNKNPVPFPKYTTEIIVIAISNAVKPLWYWMNIVQIKSLHSKYASNIEEKTVRILIVSFSCNDTLPEYISWIEFIVSR